MFSLISISICSNLVHTGIDMVYCSTRAISLSPVTNGGHAGYVHLSSIKKTTPQSMVQEVVDKEYVANYTVIYRCGEEVRIFLHFFSRPLL